NSFFPHQVPNSTKWRTSAKRLGHPPPFCVILPLGFQMELLLAPGESTKFQAQEFSHVEDPMSRSILLLSLASAFTLAGLPVNSPAQQTKHSTQLASDQVASGP